MTDNKKQNKTQQNDSLEAQKLRLQRALDQTCAYLVANPSGSFLSRATRYSEIPEEVVQKGFDAIQAALDKAREQFTVARQTGDQSGTTGGYVPGQASGVTL